MHMRASRAATPYSWPMLKGFPTGSALVLASTLWLASCEHSSDDPAPPPPQVDTALDWDRGNWDEQEWQ